MKRLMKLCATAICVSALAGCFVPEKFTAEVNLAKDGSYSYEYSGVTAFVPAIMEMVSGGKGLDDKTEKDLKNQEQKLAKSPDVRKVTYIGNGRYDMKISGERKSGQATNVLDAFRVFTDKDGVINITSAVIKPSDREELAKLGLKIDGKLSVTLPKNAEVLSSNATSSPSFFGLFGTYSWKIGSLDERPNLKIKLR